MARLLFATQAGEIFEHPYLQMAGQSAGHRKCLSDAELIELPEDSQLFTLPDRFPVGWNPETRSFETMREIPFVKGKKKEKACAVSAFPSPGYTRTQMPCYQIASDVPVLLSLWAYTAVGWDDRKGMVIAATRVDENLFWQDATFDPKKLARSIEKTLARYPGNRLYRHLAHCAKAYNCCNAKNLFYGRGEAPLPVSSSCNSRCLGCISIRNENGCQASHERISFTPTVQEILEIAVPHLMKGEETIASFGQGCEGEPLLYHELIRESLAKIREKTPQGTLHMNTNGSLPKVLPGLAKSGLDSIRVSLNSTQESRYNLYYRPRHYTFSDVLESIRTGVEIGMKVCLNYLVFPGLVDLPEEMEGIVSLVKQTGLHMIQMRNLCIDPDYYVAQFGPLPDQAIGIQEMIRTLERECPGLRIGYFNRPWNFSLTKQGKNDTRCN